jgi:hypothetical protein
MSRPPAKTLLEKNYTEESGIEILAAESLYAVVYKSQPINVKLKYYFIHGPVSKYSKTVYPNRKPAQNLADKLNQDFDTVDFTVIQVL